MWNQLSAFVAQVCADRDPSHGHEHMHSVAINSLFIYMNTESPLKNESVSDLVIAVAWLHDIIDHKYDPEKKLAGRMRTFLEGLFSPTDVQLIFDIIDRVSYSKENTAMKKKEKLDWQEVLGNAGCFVREIVSDADKLEAIGKIGIQRCMEYTSHHYFEKNHKEISQQELVAEVVKHANEKLLRLKDEFIRTTVGKKMAKPLHDEMITMLADFLSQYSWKERK